MNGVGLEILARTPVLQLSPSYQNLHRVHITKTRLFKYIENFTTKKKKKKKKNENFQIKILIFFIFLLKT